MTKTHVKVERKLQALRRSVIITTSDVAIYEQNNFVFSFSSTRYFAMYCKSSIFQVLSRSGLLNQLQPNVRWLSSSLKIKDQESIRPDRSFKVFFIDDQCNCWRCSYRLSKHRWFGIISVCRSVSSTCRATSAPTQARRQCTHLWQVLHRPHAQSILSRGPGWMANAGDNALWESRASSCSKSLALCGRGELHFYFEFIYKEFLSKSKIIFSSYTYIPVVRRHEGLQRSRRQNKDIQARDEHGENEHLGAEVGIAHLQWNRADQVPETVDQHRPRMGSALGSFELVHSPNPHWNGRELQLYTHKPTHYSYCYHRNQSMMNYFLLFHSKNKSLLSIISSPYMCHERQKLYWI